jgi:membrane fusion protein (multidrug efflux system)
MENNGKKPKKKTVPIILGIIILVGLIYGANRYIYSRHHEVTDDAQIENDISPVLSRVSGYVKEIRFEENQLVKKGDTLILIDDSDLRIKVQQARAAVENAEAAVALAEANVTTANAGARATNAKVESAKVKSWKANKDYERYSNLRKDTATSEQAYENAKAEKENADAMVSGAESEKASAEAEIVAAQKQVAAARTTVALKQADLDFATLQLSYASIMSPASGFASRKNVQLGQLVNAGSPLFAIVADSGVYILANFKETQLEKMQVGQSVEVTVDAFPETKLTGSVYIFSSATGAKFSLLPPDNATGNFVKVVQRVPVKIKISGDKNIISKLRPGMSVKVAVNTDKSE